MSVTPAQFAGTGADTEALLLKQYSGSFVSAPRSGVLLYNGVADSFIFRKRNVTGKSWQFLMMADVPEADDYDPGTDLMGQVMAIDEGTIVTDKYVVCHKWIGKDKMAQAHFDVLPQLAMAHKSRIERLYDRRAMITAAIGARRTTAVTKNGLNVHNGGNRVTRSGGSIAAAYPLSATGAANLRADFRSLGLAMSQDNILPGFQNRGIILDPYLKTVLTFDTTNQVFSRDFQDRNQQMTHKVEIVENFTILGEANTTSNNGPLPNENITDGPSKYQANFTAQASDGIPGVLAFVRGGEGQYGLGSVEFESISHLVKWFPEKLSWLVMTHFRGGCDVMHPWCLGSVEAIT